MSKLDIQEAQRLEEEYDPELRFRPLAGFAKWLVFAGLAGLSFYHYYTAGFGIPAEHWHKAVHLAAVIALLFLLFPMGKTAGSGAPAWWRPGGVPLWDWLMAGAAIVTAMYLPMTIESLTFRIGSPNLTDVVVGTVLIVTILEATRRAMGPVLPIIVLVFMAYGVFGPYAPVDLLKHPGASWEGFISHVYMTTEGIFGVPVKVVSTFVFHFVLFGVIATRMGLGQFFIDIAQCIAGRYAGGPAKVSVVSSALFGMISGSSIANTVTTGSLTIPAMKRIGYRPHFAGAVEAAASAGGQVTPPIMGAAAFVMMEFLEVNYTTIVIAAATPAFMHYLAVLTIVHLEAKRLGLRGLPAAEMPQLWNVFKRGWPTVIPLIVLIAVLFNGYTPFMAAFWGITTCIAIGLVNPMHRIGWRDVLDAFYLGGKYALVVGAAAASVGIVVGVVTLSGAGFRVSFMVTQAAMQISEPILAVAQLLPFETVTQQGLTLFLTLVFIAVACILMGAGMPTTALYIILVSIAAPALVQQGIPVLAAHMFVLYYGILADLTPPVCTAAYAAGAIAGANPFKTGTTAFRLGNAKALVPFVFVYSPAMLIVVPEYFTLEQYLATSLTCVIGVALLAIALAGFLWHTIAWPLRVVLFAAALCLVAPEWTSNWVGLALAVPVLLWQWIKARREPYLPPGAAVDLAAARESA